MSTAVTGIQRRNAFEVVSYERLLKAVAMLPSAAKETSPHFAGQEQEPIADVLFLCTGNYYRSRFAEELFNHLSISKSLPIRATSLGFAPHPDINLGSISTFTLKALADRQIIPQNAVREPAIVKAKDFSDFRLCIAMSEEEHKPMMLKLFPNFLAKVRFWQVQDLAWEKPEIALNRIVVEVQGLIEEIRKGLVVGGRL